MSRHRALVIGAGFGGLSAAAFLARDGFDVLVAERLPAIGGRAQVLEWEGFRFDMGPSWYWMPEEHDRWFSALGERRSDYYAIRRLDPSYRIFFDLADGSPEDIDVPADPAATREMFERIEPGAGARLDHYLERCRRRYEIAMRHFIYRNWDAPWQIINRSSLSNLRLLGIGQSYHGEVGRHFRHPSLRQMLEFPTVFLGAHPRRVPVVYTMMNHIESALGTWYPEGGFGAVVRAMHAVAERQGARFSLSTEVRHLMVADGRVRAALVETPTGREEIEADLVVANADYPHVDRALTPTRYRSHSERYWRRRRLAPSALNFYVALDCRLRRCAHHTFFFDADWERHLRSVYRERRWPDEPLFYLHVPSISDPGAAPPGCEALFILIPIAPGLHDSPEMRERLFRRVIERLEARTGQALRSHIRFRHDYSLDDYRRDFHAYDGTAFGLGQTLFQTAGFRPSNRSRRLPNLYYCGHFTAPGTGTTMSMISGELAARRIADDAERRRSP